MSIRQQARERWFERQVAATAGLTWPMEESKRVDPSRDPEYPYYAGEERYQLTLADDASPQVVASWAKKQDDFDPDVKRRLYVIEGVPEWSGEGAIYTPEYLKRTGA